MANLKAIYQIICTVFLSFYFYYFNLLHMDISLNSFPKKSETSCENGMPEESPTPLLKKRSVEPEVKLMEAQFNLHHWIYHKKVLQQNKRLLMKTKVLLKPDYR